MAAVAAFAVASCAFFDESVAELRTDVPQMALYADAFNASQDRHWVHVIYDADLAAGLNAPGPKPALVIGRYLKSSSARGHFQSLDYLFSELVVNQSAFYGELLDLGNLDGRQLLLPVSFNLPLIMFDKKQEAQISNSFTLELAELEKLAVASNKETKGSWTALGFGPRWSPEFLYNVVQLKGGSFREGAPLSWDASSLAQGIQYLREWTVRANGSAAREDEFQFKYLYLPPGKSVQEGRIAFAAMDSSEFFVIPEERRASLSFRWLAGDGKLPISDGIVYAGICRRSSGKQAAEAFLKWFYSEDTQKTILDDARRFRSSELSFGIAGGFSAVRQVNEKLFPLYYPSLLGRLPPARSLSAPAILPSSWPAMKAQIVLPFLVAATGPDGSGTDTLAARIQSWLKRQSSN